MSSRYNAKPTDRFRSKLENHVWKTRPKLRGVKYGYETTAISYVSEHTYTPDFTVILPDNRVIYIEVKGYFRPEDKRKMKLVKQQNPHLDIRMVLSAATNSNINWCEKWGFPWAWRHIPEDWLK